MRELSCVCVHMLSDFSRVWLCELFSVKNKNKYMILTTGEITFKKGSIKIFINNTEKIHTSKPSLKAMLSFQKKEKQLVSSVSQSCLFATPWTAAHQASLCITSSQSLLKLMSIESVMPSNHLILCHPLLLLPSIFPQHQGLFQWVSSLYQVAKVLEFQLQHKSFQWIYRTDFL